MIAIYCEYASYQERQKIHFARLDILAQKCRFLARYADKATGNGLYDR